MEKFIKLIGFALIVITNFSILSGCQGSSSDLVMTPNNNTPTRASSMNSNHESGMQSSNIVSSKLEDVKLNENGVIVEYYKAHEHKTNEEKLNLYRKPTRKMEVFEYKIKDSYASREEIELELIDLGNCFNWYSDVTSEQKLKAIEVTEQIKEKLNKMLEQFPLSEEEKKLRAKQEQVNDFYNKLSAYQMDMYGWKETHQYYVRENKQEEASLKEEAQIMSEKAGAAWEKAKKIKNDYEIGKVTIEDAEIKLNALERAQKTQGSPPQTSDSGY